MIGNDLVGKIHVYCGDMDNYYLNLAVYHLEDFLKVADNPKSEAVFEYGRPMKPHGWQPFTNAELVRKLNDGSPKIVFQHEREDFQQALRARGVLPATQ